jgi:hypothetical protein
MCCDGAASGRDKGVSVQVRTVVHVLEWDRGLRSDLRTRPFSQKVKIKVRTPWWNVNEGTSAAAATSVPEELPTHR